MASDSFHWLKDGHRDSPPPGEETLTDVHIRHLRQAMDGRIKVVQFNKAQESRNGADWELWIHNRSHGVGLRIQAKRANARGQYDVAYWLPQPEAYQCDLLIQHAFLAECVPVYLLYNHLTWSLNPEASQWLCSHTAPDDSHHGCSLLSAYYVQSQLFGVTAGCNISHRGLRNASLPWNRVLCDERTTEVTADPRGFGILEGLLTAVHALEKDGKATLPARPSTATPSHAWSDNPRFQLARPLSDERGEDHEGGGEPQLRPLPERVLALLYSAPGEEPYQPDVPTRGVILYDVTDVDAPRAQQPHQGCLVWRLRV
ncbi:hypothetical protein H4K36_25410 [Streptomyces sp. DHE7-1]|nr:hypothetical protein [Streptomyces sp. DHE7-1]